MHSLPHTTFGKVSSVGMDKYGPLLRIDGTMLSGQSGGAVVVEYVSGEAKKKNYAVVGVSSKSVTGELGDVRRELCPPSTAAIAMPRP